MRDTVDFSDQKKAFLVISKDLSPTLSTSKMRTLAILALFLLLKLASLDNSEKNIVSSGKLNRINISEKGKDVLQGPKKNKKKGKKSKGTNQRRKKIQRKNKNKKSKDKKGKNKRRKSSRRNKKGNRKKSQRKSKEKKRKEKKKLRKLAKIRNTTTCKYENNQKKAQTWWNSNNNAKKIYLNLVAKESNSKSEKTLEIFKMAADLLMEVTENGTKCKGGDPDAAVNAAMNVLNNCSITSLASCGPVPEFNTSVAEKCMIDLEEVKEQCLKKEKACCDFPSNISSACNASSNAIDMRKIQKNCLNKTMSGSFRNCMSLVKEAAVMAMKCMPEQKPNCPSETTTTATTTATTSSSLGSFK